jgi:hypothetical protein
MKSDETALFCKQTDLYVEFEQTIEDKYMVWYLIPRDKHSYFIATCWVELERVFQPVRDGEIDLDDVFDTWPSMQRLIKNGKNEKFSEGALIRDSDLDTGDATWFLLSIVGNQKIESVDGIFEGRSGETVQQVIKESVELLNELHTRSPSIIKALWRGVKLGVKSSSEIILDSVFEGLAGAFSDSEPTYVQRLKLDFDARTEEGAKKILRQLQS